MKPFLKWAGGKHRIVGRVRALLPAGTRLIEPFVGSAAVFLNTSYPHALLADANPDLIQLYQVLRADGRGFIEAAGRLFTPENNTAAAYYELRRAFNAETDVRRKAALFLYLNRHGYNGLCRYNRRGAFNVPFGRYKQPYFPEPELWYFYQRAQSAQFRTADFATVMDEAVPGDVIYCDPPYVPLSKTARFTSYSSAEFGVDAQRRLAECARAAAARGIPVLISNHANEVTEELYAGAEIHVFEVRRSISCDGTNRGTALEMLALFRPSS
ncbi:MAG: Dam family site-specific DNA-(adenine-N6)-methyltransferase [Alicyclobacillus sp.]|nr:Dam family site-specific DNA-(adenine-N6)-methyltransferase [Alicyclobacillus sp.]